MNSVLARNRTIREYFSPNKWWKLKPAKIISGSPDLRNTTPDEANLVRRSSGDARRSFNGQRPRQVNGAGPFAMAARLLVYCINGHDSNSSNLRGAY